jgi:hypothetical protein
VVNEQFRKITYDIEEFPTHGEYATKNVVKDDYYLFKFLYKKIEELEAKVAALEGYDIAKGTVEARLTALE